ncbi:MAG: lipopolysaccharide biosynthesis protein [Bacteroidales bacterium]|nr:lipopolysaccharide biosynthesis protein [Bacteroidales bacterium]
MGVIAKQSIRGTFVTYLGVAIGAFTTFVVLTHFLTEEEIGLTRVLVEAATMLSGLAQLGTSASILRFYPYFKDEEHHDHGFFFWTLVVPLVGFLIFCLLYLALQVPVKGYFEQNSKLFNDYYYFVLPLAFCLVYMTIFESNANVLLKIVVPKFVREVLVRVLSLAVYVLYGLRVLSLDGFVIAFCGVYAVAMLVDLVYLFRMKRISLKPDRAFLTKPLRKDYALYTLFLVVGAVAATITPFLNTFFVSGMLGLKTTGVFTIAVFIASVVEVPFRSLGAIAQPHISQAVKDNDIGQVNDLCKTVSLHQLLVGGLLFFLIWANIDVIYDVLPNGDRYRDGKWVVFFFGLYKLVYSTLNVGATVLNYSKKYYFSLIFTFLMTGMGIAFNLWLIPRFGMVGSAMATLLANLLYYALMLGFNRWVIKTNLFSWKQLVVLALVGVLFALDALWTRYLTPFAYRWVANGFWAGLLNAVVKSVVWLALSAAIVYRLKISLSVNDLINRVLRVLRIRPDK